MSTTIGAVRWTLKKASRTAIAHGSRLISGTLLRKDHIPHPLVRALTYHRFGHTPRDPFCLSPDDFAPQMRYIARAGLATSLAELESHLSGTDSGRRDAVLVTVDDGFRSLRTVALPILREYAIPAVAFVSSGLLGFKREAGRSSAPEDYLDWRDLEALAAQGISIQSHGWSHRSLARLNLDDLREELSRSKQLLEDRLGTQIAAFAYPFGTQADFNTRVAASVRETGYRLGFTAQHGAIRHGADPFMLPRTKVESGETLMTFAALVHGGLDVWRWIDRGLWRLQSSERAAR